MLKPNDVKPFLAHSDPFVRQFAACYFADSKMEDSDLMNIVMDHIMHSEDQETTPDDEQANELMLSYARNYRQTQETFSEMLSRLGTNDRYNLRYRLVLGDSGPRLLAANLSRLTAYPDLHKKAEQAVEIVNMPTLELWNRLLSFCEEHAEHYVNQFDYAYGVLIVRELAARNDLPYDEMEKLRLDQDCDMGYQAIYLSMLIGELRDEKWIPYLVDNLTSEGDLICEVASDALAAIGTPAVIDCLRKRYYELDDEYKYYIPSLLGHIKIPEAEEALLSILPGEEDEDLAVFLADSLCQLLSVRGIPIVQEMIGEGYNSEILELEESLYCCSIITGTELPETVEYGEMIREDRERRRKRALELAKGIRYQGDTMLKPPKIGRNGPCPCGSGKKYKKCCLNK